MQLHPLQFASSKYGKLKVGNGLVNWTTPSVQQEDKRAWIKEMDRKEQMWEIL